MSRGLLEASRPRARQLRLNVLAVRQRTLTATMPRRPKPSSNQPPSTSAASTSPSPSHTDAILFPTPAAFASWLRTNHASTPQGIWLRISKKSAPEPSVTYDEALDIALCYGWIDGQRKSLPIPGTHFAQRFTPRRRGSLWSRRNVEKVAVLEADGRMQEAGRAEVQAAREDGRWERAYAGSRDVQVPTDFETALRARGNEVWEFFDALGKTQRYPFLMRLQTAKTEEMRRKKMEQFVDLLAERKTL